MPPSGIAAWGNGRPTPSASIGVLISAATPRQRARRLSATGEADSGRRLPPRGVGRRPLPEPSPYSGDAGEGGNLRRLMGKGVDIPQMGGCDLDSTPTPDLHRFPVEGARFTVVPSGIPLAGLPSLPRPVPSWITAATAAANSRHPGSSRPESGSQRIRGRQTHVLTGKPPRCSPSCTTTVALPP
jgi:hypothetical protein